MLVWGAIFSVLGLRSLLLRSWRVFCAMLPITIRRQVEAEGTWGVGSGEWGVGSSCLETAPKQSPT